MDIKVKKRNGRLVDFQVDKINAEFEDAMKRMSTMIGKNYGKKQAKKTNN